MNCPVEAKLAEMGLELPPSAPSRALFLPGKISVDNLVLPLLGFVIFTAAYLAEVIRGGLASLARGWLVALDLDMSAGTEGLLKRLPDQFALAHEARYGHSNPGERVEFVNLRMAAYGQIERPGRSALTPLYSQTLVRYRPC